MNFRYLRIISSLMLGMTLLSLVVACGDSTATSVPTTSAANPTAAATSKWSLAEAAKPYKGQKVTLATVAWKDATVDLAKEFTATTGIELEVVQLPNAELLQKTLLDARTKTGSYDIIAHSPMTPYAKPGYLVALDDYLKGPLADPEFNLKDAVNVDFYTKYSGKTYSLPFGSSALALFYRKDLFENTQYMSDFKAKYGYDLKPPTDWKQLLDISKFFTDTDWKGPNGEKGYGLAAWGKREGSMSYLLELHNSSLAALKTNSNLSLLDDKLQPTFNNPTGEEALSIWKQTLQYSPPGVLQNGLSETRDLFAKGLTAMVINWDSSLGTLLTSPIKDKWALAGVPGRTVLGGWTLSLNTASKNKEAAFLATQFLTSAKADMYIFDKAGRYPARSATYSSDLYKSKNPFGEILAKSKGTAVPQVDVENIQIDSFVSEQISLYLTDQKDAKSTLKDTAEGITKILKDGGWLN